MRIGLAFLWAIPVIVIATSLWAQFPYDPILDVQVNATALDTTGLALTDITFPDDVAAEFGTGVDYWWIYDSSNTQLELNSTNCDGSGTDCVVALVDDGTSSLDMQSHLLLNIGAAGTDFTTSGGLTLAAAFIATSTSDLRGNISNSTGNVTVADTLQVNVNLVSPFDTTTVADDGGGTSPAFNYQPGGNASRVRVTCNDANGCALTLSETGVASGTYLFISNASGSAGNVTIADSAGVQETTGALSLGPLDNVRFVYDNDRWVQDGPVNNL